MKHLKEFENDNMKFKLNDIVVLINRTIRSKDLPETMKDNITTYLFHILKTDPKDDMYKYCIEDLYDTDTFWCKESQLRLATEKELEQYKLEQEANKYNL